MKRRNSSWLTRAAAFALALSVCAACSDSTGPGGDLDPSEAATSLDRAMTRFVDENPALQSLSVLSTPIFGAIGTDFVALSVLPRPGSGMSGWAEGLRLSVSELSEVGGSANIPIGLAGKTFTYNPSTGEFEIDEGRGDAPANGVRFVLYAVDPILFEPIEPLEEIGYLDIVDTSDFPTAAIGMTAVVDGVTLVQMDVSGSSSQSSGSFSFDGFLSDGEDQFSFEIGLQATQTTGSLGFQAHFDVYTVTLSFAGDESLENGSFTATFSDEDDTIAFNLGVDAATIQDGSAITINGEQVAIISGSTEEPTITNAAGDPLSQGELDALGELFAGLGNVIELFFGLLEFGVVLLTLAFV